MSTILGRLHVEERRKHGEKGITNAAFKLHATAHESRGGAIATRANYAILVRAVALDQVEEVNRWRGRCAAYHVCVASCNDDQVAGLQWYGFGHTINPEPTASAHDYVKYRPVISDTDTPRSAELGPEVHTASKTYTTQQVSEERFAPRVGGFPRRILVR